MSGNTGEMVYYCTCFFYIHNWINCFNRAISPKKCLEVEKTSIIFFETRTNILF